MIRLGYIYIVFADLQRITMQCNQINQNAISQMLIKYMK
jgi:hypothetical protein